MIILRGCFSSVRLRDRKNRLLVSISSNRFMSQSRSRYYVCQSMSRSIHDASNW
jgi:hypothetical protein